jgi:hypothetical protein
MMPERDAKRKNAKSPPILWRAFKIHEEGKR